MNRAATGRLELAGCSACCLSRGAHGGPPIDACAVEAGPAVSLPTVPSPQLFRRPRVYSSATISDGCATGSGMQAYADVTDQEAADDDAAVRAACPHPRAFAPLYARYAEPVYRYAHRRLGDPERAADATSQTFLKALAALPGYRIDGPGTFRSWLFAIAHNVVVDVVRRSQTVPLSPGWDAADAGPLPDDAALAAERRAQLYALLTLLPADQRRVIELRLSGLSGQEIAASLGRSLTAVKSLQWRAFQRLKELVEAADGDDDPPLRETLHVLR